MLIHLGHEEGYECSLHQGGQESDNVLYFKECCKFSIGLLFSDFFQCIAGWTNRCQTFETGQSTAVTSVTLVQLQLHYENREPVAERTPSPCSIMCRVYTDKAVYEGSWQ